MKLILFLVNKGARLDIKNAKKEFPIDIAVGNNDWEIVEFIVKISNLRNKNNIIRKNINPFDNYTDSSQIYPDEDNEMNSKIENLKINNFINRKEDIFSKYNKNIHFLPMKENDKIQNRSIYESKINESSMFSPHNLSDLSYDCKNINKNHLEKIQSINLIRNNDKEEYFNKYQNTYKNQKLQSEVKRNIHEKNIYRQDKSKNNSK